MTEVSISALCIYPVKSLAGIQVSEAKATLSGLKGDRQWAIFKASGGMLTQRQIPAMAKVTPTLTNGGLILHSPEAGQIEVEAPPTSAPVEQLQIWKDLCFGQYASEDVNEWLTTALNSPEPLKLAKFHPESTREYSKPERFDVQGKYFSDAAPYLVANDASVELLNRGLQAQNLEPVDMRRFRPNIVLSGIDAFTEHHYHGLQATDESLSFRLVDHCQRCSIITVNPDTGQYLPKAVPFKSLSQLNGMPDNPKAPAFGVNSTLTSGDGETISVGQHFILQDD